jgi:hypothetical protein
MFILGWGRGRQAALAVTCAPRALTRFGNLVVEQRQGSQGLLTSSGAVVGLLDLTQWSSCSTRVPLANSLPCLGDVNSDVEMFIGGVGGEGEGKLHLLRVVSSCRWQGVLTHCLQPDIE